MRLIEPLEFSNGLFLESQCLLLHWLGYWDVLVRYFGSSKIYINHYLGTITDTIHLCLNNAPRISSNCITVHEWYHTVCDNRFVSCDEFLKIQLKRLTKTYKQDCVPPQNWYSKLSGWVKSCLWFWLYTVKSFEEKVKDAFPSWKGIFLHKVQYKSKPSWIAEMVMIFLLTTDTSCTERQLVSSRFQMHFPA